MSARSPIPLYHQVSRVLRRRIVDGEYALGSRLVAEDELAGEFGVSRATVRQAVGELVAAGLVSREQGRGTFVRAQGRTRFGVTFHGDLDDLRRVSAEPGGRVATLEIEHDVALPAEIGRALDVPVGTVVRRTLERDGTPFARHVDHLPDRYGRLLTAAGLRERGVVALLAEAGVDLGTARQEITARPADAEVAEALDVPLGSPVLAAERWHHAVDGSGVGVNQAWYPGEDYRFTVQFDRREP